MDIITAITGRYPFVFVKFGDGEWAAASYQSGGNCDSTPYTHTLGDAVTSAFQYLVQQPNVYIGKWHQPHVPTYFESLTDQPVPWTDFMTFLLSAYDPAKTRIYRAIRYASQKKIYVCNDRLQAFARSLLQLQACVTIHPSLWFQKSYTETLQMILREITDPTNTIVLISAGMGGKPLIADLHRHHPQLIILDVGSGLDSLCTRHLTRSYHAELEKSRYQILADIVAPPIKGD